MQTDGVIFSGGNSLNKFHKNKENNIRDKFEKIANRNFSGEMFHIRCL